MLQPAHVGHLAMLRSLIRQGAQDGSFDRELGARVAGGRGVLRQAEAGARHRLLRRGRPHRPDRHRRRAGLRVLARRPEQRHSQPAGFGLFRALDAGYELWLAGLDLDRARRRPRARAARGALRHAAGTEDLRGARPARLALRERAASTCSPISDSYRSATRRACAGSCATRHAAGRSRRACATPSKRASR